MSEKHLIGVVVENGECLLYSLIILLSPFSPPDTHTPSLLGLLQPMAGLGEVVGFKRGDADVVHKLRKRFALET